MGIYLIKAEKDNHLRSLLVAVGLIQGFDEAVRGMNIGEVRVARLDPSVAYGERGSPPSIPPNTPIIFRIELVSIQ